MWRLLGHYLLEDSFSLFQFSVLLGILLDLNMSITFLKCSFLFFLSISQCHILGIFSELLIGFLNTHQFSFYFTLFSSWNIILKKKSLISWFLSVSRYAYCIFFLLSSEWTYLLVDLLAVFLNIRHLYLLLYWFCCLLWWRSYFSCLSLCPPSSFTLHIWQFILSAQTSLPMKPLAEL